MAQLAHPDESDASDPIDPWSEGGVTDQVQSHTSIPSDDIVALQVRDSLSEDASSNPGLAIVLAVIGVASLAGAVLGAIKGFVKVAVILGLLAAGAWFFYLSR